MCIFPCGCCSIAVNPPPRCRIQSLYSCNSFPRAQAGHSLSPERILEQCRSGFFTYAVNASTPSYAVSFFYSYSTISSKKLQAVLHAKRKLRRFWRVFCNNLYYAIPCFLIAFCRNPDKSASTTVVIIISGIMYVPLYVSEYAHTLCPPPAYTPQINTPEAIWQT